MTATLPPMIRFQPIVVDINNPGGVVIPGGKVYFYQAGTNTPQNVYAEDGTTSIGNVLTLDANGATDFRLGDGLSYKIDLTDALGTPVTGWPVDKVSSDSIATTLKSDLASSSTGKGDSLVAVLSSLSGAVATTQHEVNERSRSVFDWLSAAQKADVSAGTGSIDCSAAFQAAIDWASSLSVFMTGGARVTIPRGKYLISTTLTLSTSSQNVILEGEGMSATVLVNGIVHATAAEPLFKFLSYGNRNVLKNLSIIGNGIVGAGGNGHAIAFYDNRGTAGVTTFANGQFLIENVGINDHLGFGKDVAGAAMPACGIYGYAALDTTMRRVQIFNCKRGKHLELCDKSRFYDLTIDGCTNNCIYLKSCTNGLTYYGAVLNGSGSGGTTDGLIYANNCSQINFIGGRAKNGNPLVVNLAGSTVVNESITFDRIALSQLDPTSGHTIAKIGTGNNGVKFRDCRFTADTSMSDAVGIDFIQGVNGMSLMAPEVTGCRFSIGDAGTFLACIRTNTTNYIRGGNFSYNTFGTNGNSGVATTYTDCILMQGNYEGCTFFGNVFSATANVTMTHTFRLAGAPTNVIVGASVYEVNGGTITNKLEAAGQVGVIVLADGTYSSGISRTYQVANAGKSKTNLAGATSYALTIGFTYYHLTNPGASLAVALPAANANLDGVVYTVMVASAVATATWTSSGGSVVGAPSAIVAYTPYRFIYSHVSLEWTPY